MKMTQDELRAMIQSTNGKMFSCSFTKANGQKRKLTGRLNVVKHLRGGHSTTAHKSNLVTVYDVNAAGYRNLNLDTLETFTFGGKTYNLR